MEFRPPGSSAAAELPMSPQAWGDHTRLRASQLDALADALAAVLPLTQPADTALHQFFRRKPALGQLIEAWFSRPAGLRTTPRSDGRCRCANEISQGGWEDGR